MKLKINYTDLLDTPEFCYFLGLLYSDGYIAHTNRTYVVAITTTEENLDQLRSIFGKFCDFKQYFRQREHWKLSCDFKFFNKDFYNFIIGIGFDNKQKNAQTIINKIQNPGCRQLFFTGYFDGDGCVYYNQKQFLRQASICSSAGQDWGFMINLCEQLNIKNYNISICTNNRGHQSSNFRICNKAEFNLFLSYIYGNEQYGFLRKKDKFKEAMSSCKDGARFNPGLRELKMYSKYPKNQ